MKTATYNNGNLRLLLIPETSLETAFLQEMAEQSEKGATTVFCAPAAGDNQFVLEVGQR